MKIETREIAITARTPDEIRALLRKARADRAASTDPTNLAYLAGWIDGLEMALNGRLVVTTIVK